MARITKNMEKQVQEIHSQCDELLAPFVRLQNGAYTIINAEGLKTALLQASQELKLRVQGGKESLENVVTEAFALVRAAFILQTEGKIVLYDEQLLAGLAMMNGNVSEMATGEGKTFVQALVAYTHALAGKGVHVMSANQYLVERDAKENAPVYNTLGMSVGIVYPLQSGDKKEYVAKQMAYGADITYVTDKEIGFDYLRDSRCTETKRLLLRGVVYAHEPETLGESHEDELTEEELREIAKKVYIGEPSHNSPRTGFYTCVLDEADSLMLDNARTPLILSCGENVHQKATSINSSEVLFAVDDIVRQIIQEAPLQPAKEPYIQHSEDSSQDNFTLEATDRFFELKEQHPVLKYMSDADVLYVFSRAERAHLQIKKNENYMLVTNENGKRTGNFVLLDKNTGRIMPSSRYTEGVQQAVEAKEKNALLTLLFVDNIVRQVIKEDAGKGNVYIQNVVGTTYRQFSQKGYARCVELAHQNEKLKHIENETLQNLFHASQMAHLCMHRDEDYVVSTDETGKAVQNITIKKAPRFSSWVNSSDHFALLEQAVEIKEQDEPYVLEQMQARDEFLFYEAQGARIMRRTTLLDVRRKQGVAVSKEEEKDPVLNMPYSEINKTYKRFHVLSDESPVLATINQQTYFSFYENKAGMTGTAMSSASEFEEVYGMNVVSIPTHKPKQRVDEPAKLFATKEEKYRQIVEDVQTLHKKQVPILIGTANEEEALEIAERLKNAGFADVQTLTARDNAKESTIVANAGKRNAITVTTNVGGRGTDIKLGGARDGSIPEKQRAADKAYIESQGGLHVLITQLSESQRVDDQLRGRSGRQGDKGTTCLYVSAQDDIVKYLSNEELKELENCAKIYADIEASSPENQKKKQGTMQRNYRKSLVLLERAQNCASGMAELSRVQSYKIDKIQAENRKFTTEMRQQLLLISSGEKGEVEKLPDILKNVISFYLENVLKAETKTLSSSRDLQTIDRALNDYVFQSDENFVRSNWNTWVKDETNQLNKGSDKQRLSALAQCVANTLVNNVENINKMYTDNKEEKKAYTAFAKNFAKELLTIFDEAWVEFSFAFQELQRQLYFEQQFGKQFDYMKEIENRSIMLYGEMLQNIGLKFTQRTFEASRETGLTRK